MVVEKPGWRPKEDHNGEEEQFFRTEFLRKKIKNFGGQLNNDTWRERKERGGGDQTGFFFLNKIFKGQLQSDT